MTKPRSQGGGEKPLTLSVKKQWFMDGGSKYCILTIRATKAGNLVAGECKCTIFGIELPAQIVDEKGPAVFPRYAVQPTQGPSELIVTFTSISGEERELKEVLLVGPADNAVTFAMAEVQDYEMQDEVHLRLTLTGTRAGNVPAADQDFNIGLRGGLQRTEHLSPKGTGSVSVGPVERGRKYDVVVVTGVMGEQSWTVAVGEKPVPQCESKIRSLAELDPAAPDALPTTFCVVVSTYNPKTMANVAGIRISVIADTLDKMCKSEATNIDGIATITGIPFDLNKKDTTFVVVVPGNARVSKTITRTQLKATDAAEQPEPKPSSLLQTIGKSMRDMFS